MKLAISFMILSLLAIGVISSADAQPFNYEVPFQYGDSGCTVFEDGQYKLAQCYMEESHFVDDDPSNPEHLSTETDDGCAEGYDRDFITEECKLPEVIVEEAQKAYEESQKDPVISPTIEFEGRFFDNTPVSPTDVAIIKSINNMLETDAHCYQGSDGSNTAGIQNERSFPVPTIIIQKLVDGIMRDVTILDLRPTTSNEDLKSYLGVIEGFKQECRAQMMLDDTTEGAKILSVADKHFAYCDDLPNTSVEFDPMCGKIYKDHSVIAADVPIWSQARTNEEANFNADFHQWNIVDDVCNGFYTQTWKMTFQECRDIRDAKQTGSTVGKSTEIQNDVEDALNAFKADGGAAMFEQLQKDKIAEQISRLFKQIRALENQ